MELSFHNKIRQELGKIGVNTFETLMNDLMEVEFIKWGTLERNQTINLKIRKGKPDAHIKTKEGKYIVFNYTTTEERNIKAKILKDIKELFSENSLFKNDIIKIITCTNSPIDENRSHYESLAKELGCEYEIYSIDRLCDLLKRSHFLLKKFFDIDIEFDVSIKYYECGERIQILREQRKLTRSEFIDLLSIRSEKELGLIEEKVAECSSSLTEEICELTGCNLKWLKHGLGEIYPQLKLTDLKKEKISKDYYYPGIQNAFFAIEPVSMRILIIVKYSDIKYGIINYDYGTSFTFWNWGSDLHNIEKYFDELITLYQKLNKYYPTGRVLSEEEYKKLITFNYYPAELFENLYHDGKSWMQNLIDLKDNSDKKVYSDHFEWFQKMKPYFIKYYLKEECEIPDGFYL